MKIITEPLSSKGIIDKSRHLTGFNRWAQSSRIVSFILLLFEWLTIPFEVIFRKDFGQRWLTAVNFAAGVALIFFIYCLQFYWNVFIDFFVNTWNSIIHLLHPFSTAPAEVDSNANDQWNILVLTWLLYCYLPFGIYHLFKAKWRNQANIPLHSFDDGTSRLLWAGAIIKWILNIVSIPLMVVFWLLLPRKQRSGRPFPRLIDHRETFTNVAVEPALILYIGSQLTSVARIYFCLSALAIFIHAQRKEIARKSKILDFQDGRIEADMMKEMRRAQKVSMQLYAKAVKRTPSAKATKILKPVTVQHAHISVIIDELQRLKQTSDND